MKKIIFITIIILNLLCSCKDNPVQEYSNTLSTSLKKSQDIALQSEISNLKKALQSFSEEMGKLPASIEELEKYINRPIDKEKIQYNPETGEISAK